MQVNNGGGSGANTVLIVLVIIILLVGGWYVFGRGASAPAADDNSGINVDINLPEGGSTGGTVEEGASGGGPAY